MKIMISGGHLTPALAVMDYALKKGDSVVFVGRSYSSHVHKIKSREKAEVEKRDVEFVNFDSFKIHWHNKLLSIFSFPKIIKAIFQARKIIKIHKPDIFVSFGGYLAVPLAIAAKNKNIPIITHEQTRYLGLANKFIAKFADIIAISWQDTKNIPISHKVKFTGNPIRKSIKSPSQKPSWVNNDKPIIYVTGGNQGSMILNQTIQRLISNLSKKYSVIHQCGGSKDNNYKEELNQTKDQLPENQKNNYQVSDWFSSQEVSWILDNAKCVISRAGANTVTELIYKTTPSILIPLPFSSQSEQQKNAQFLEKNQSALVIPQNKLTDEYLLLSIRKVIDDCDSYKKNLVKLKSNIIKNSEEKIYQLISRLYEENQKK